MVERLPNRDDEPATRGDLKELRTELRSEMARADVMNERFNAVDQRFIGVDQRFDSVNQRFDSVDQRLTAQDKFIEAKFNGMRFEVRAWMLGAFLVWSGGAEAGMNWVKALFS